MLFLLGLGLGTVLGMSLSLLIVVHHARRFRRTQHFPLPRNGVRG